MIAVYINNAYQYRIVYNSVTTLKYTSKIVVNKNQCIQILLIVPVNELQTHFIF